MKLTRARKWPETACHTTSYSMHFVLNEKVNQRHQCTKKARCEDFSILDGLRIWGTERQTTEGPWQGSYKIRNHEYVMPVVVIGRCNICPAAAGDRPKKSSASHDPRESRVRTRRKDIPQKDQCEARA